MKQKLLLFALAATLPVLIPMFAQHVVNEPAIKKAIEAKQYQSADSIFKLDVSKFISVNNFDTLAAYVTYAGEIANGISGAAKASPAVFSYIDYLKKNKAAPALLVKAYRNAAELLGNIGQNKSGYEASLQALNYTIQQPGHLQTEIAKCEYNLGVYAHRLGNIVLSQQHHIKAMLIREADNNTPQEDIYLSANAIGVLLWYGSKYDSAILFFNKALSALSKMPGNDLNQYFRPGNIENNMAAVYSAQGKTSEAIKAMQNTIDDFQQFIDSKEPNTKKQSATEGLYEGIDNLAGIYKEIGDYGKAGELLNYSYQKKLQKLDPDHPGIFISEILLGQHYHSINENDKALEYLQKGLGKLEKSGGDYLFWAADAYYNIAMIYEARNDYINALQAYKKSESLYETSYGGQYDNVYMDFLRNESVFYAKNHDYANAYLRAEKVYHYLKQVGQGSSLQGFYQLLNIAEINYISGRYKEAIMYCNTALGTLNERIKDGVTLLDSVKMEVFKPKAILINAKAAYELQVDRDSAFLNHLAAKLNDALVILEKRKVLIDDEASINILIADHQELIDFAKKIALELYGLTGNTFHLDKFINLHESALYNRIRSRIDKQQAVHFSRLPAEVEREETQLKAAITASLQSNKNDSSLMKDYIAAVNRWEAHLEKVKINYPAYYNLRYASIFKPLQQLQASIPDSLTIVRYIFVDASLMALVADKQHKTLVKLNTNKLQEKINQTLSQHINEKELLPILYDLYVQLWKPIDAAVHTKKVMVIPDGYLYNLSFDALTENLVTTYSGLSANSLLSKYNFSYHYSLFVLGQQVLNNQLKGNYVAFAPGFTDEVKHQYVSTVKDSVKLDYSYLKLLPQPATNKLAIKIKDMIGGNIFLNENSTQSSFVKNAGGHSIIHIATHAEYNNINPEKSGLIFAKNITASQDSNFLSLTDIYNCNMQSDLTLLTACESGKPGYQDGEGMISLAHAFNYAGSRQILTALWKIDEQSSSRITELFIKNIKAGKPTDEALRLAKLDYLKTTDGRMLAPSYWAGLVIMGQPSTLLLAEKTNLAWWLISLIGIAVLITAYFLLSRKSLSNKRTFKNTEL